MDDLLEKLKNVRLKQNYLKKLIRNTPLGEKRTEYLESLEKANVELKKVKKEISKLKLEQRKEGRSND